MVLVAACIRTDDNIDNYAADVRKYQAESFMPGLEGIGNYKEIEYFSRKDNTFFPEYSIQLVVKYDEEIFLTQKDRLENKYTYLEEPQKPKSDDTVYTIPAEEFSINEFDYKVVEFDDTVYPKNFGMVGISDDRCEIAYLWVYAPDLDYICRADQDKYEEMIEFVEYHFSSELL